MPTGRHGHPCAALVLNNTKVIVIADLYYPSRSKRVDFLIQDKWISGPSLPNYYHDAHELVSNGETLFYVNTYDNVFLRMECESINSCIWIEMEQKLQIPRSNAVVKLIPDHLAECSIAPTTTSTLEYLIAVLSRTSFLGDFPWHTLLLDTSRFSKFYYVEKNNFAF